MTNLSEFVNYGNNCCRPPELFLDLILGSKIIKI